ncbi:lipocalin-like domain-containing protein, partial [Halorhodospira neutriphila]|uniref:lipocalin-like domain-containing protein n=1 Tax=Halorhodospira neutriphila TaxID=168379 RepID=UPI001F5BCF6B
ALLAAAVAACGEAPPPGREGPSGEAGVNVAEALSGEQEAAGFARPQGPRPLLFPADHGPHPDYRHEWWYVTGNLESEAGRHFGFQATFFRFALTPEPLRLASRWATRQLWMAHFTVTDTAAGRFHHFERFSRGALGLAGARAEPFRVWLEDWALTAVGGDFDELRARLAAEGVAVDLRLELAKPLVLQGERGYSRKGAEPGNASYYYSAPRLAAAGEVTTPAGRHRVSGTAWIDREWGTSALSEGQSGWDWISLQLDSGRELMLYRLRREDGSTDPRSAGVWIDRQGSSRPLDWGDLTLEVLERWESPDGEATYPARWRLEYPEEGVELVIEPTLADQELRGGFRYWEGAVRASGRSAEGPVSGVGYVELTGYTE